MIACKRSAACNQEAAACENTCNMRIRCAGIFGGALGVGNDENAIEWTHPPTRVWVWREGLFLDRVCLGTWHGPWRGTNAC